MDNDPFFDFHSFVSEVIFWVLVGFAAAHLLFSIVPRSVHPEVGFASIVTGLIAIPLSFWLFSDN